jgi:hypothetical protein
LVGSLHPPSVVGRNLSLLLHNTGHIYWCYHIDTIFSISCSSAILNAPHVVHVRL